MIRMFGKIYRKIAKSLIGTGISKFAIVRKVHKKMLSQTALESIDVFGYKLFLHPSYQSYSVTLENEDKSFQILRKFIQKGDTVIDIGANIGLSTLFFRSLVGETGKIIAFEPDITNFNLLKKNIISNNFENVEIFQKAVGNTNSHLKMKLGEEMGRHQISDSGSEEVDCIRLDDYVTSANFLKMDVEGYEIKVLEGMPNLLRQKIILMSEFYVKLSRNHSSPVDFFTIMKKNGFTCQDMMMELQSITESNFMLNYDENSDATDILCIKE